MSREVASQKAFKDAFWDAQGSFRGEADPKFIILNLLRP